MDIHTSKLRPKMDSSWHDALQTYPWSELWLAEMRTNPVITSISVKFLSKFPCLVRRLSFVSWDSPSPLVARDSYTAVLIPIYQSSDSDVKGSDTSHMCGTRVPSCHPLILSQPPWGNGGNSVTKLADTDSGYEPVIPLWFVAHLITQLFITKPATLKL